jgi:tmRNA-binding protein
MHYVQKEILKLGHKLLDSSMTIIPLRCYFNIRSVLKVEIALAKAKTFSDTTSETENQNEKYSDFSKARNDTTPLHCTFVRVVQLSFAFFQRE